MRFEGKLREINTKLFLVSSLGLAHMLYDDYILMIMT
jgi:hypothetical protein